MAPIHSLPVEVTEKILDNLALPDLISCSRASKYFRDLIESEKASPQTKITLLRTFSAEQPQQYLVWKWIGPYTAVRAKDMGQWVAHLCEPVAGHLLLDDKHIDVSTIRPVHELHSQLDGFVIPAVGDDELDELHGWSDAEFYLDGWEFLEKMPAPFNPAKRGWLLTTHGCKQVEVEFYSSTLPMDGDETYTLKVEASHPEGFVTLYDLHRTLSRALRRYERHEEARQRDPNVKHMRRALGLCKCLRNARKPLKEVKVTIYGVHTHVSNCVIGAKERPRYGKECGRGGWDAKA